MIERARWLGIEEALFDAMTAERDSSAVISAIHIIFDFRDEIDGTVYYTCTLPSR
jgi:hypothetical protein